MGTLLLVVWTSNSVDSLSESYDFVFFFFFLNALIEKPQDLVCYYFIPMLI